LDDGQHSVMRSNCSYMTILANAAA